MEVDVSTAGKQLAKLVQNLDDTGPVTLTRYGKPVATLAKIILVEGLPRPLPGPSRSWLERNPQQTARDKLLRKEKRKEKRKENRR